MTRIPLAEQMRPESLDDVIGQSQLLGDGEILRRIVAQREPVSLILWGPPGTGKTTLARIIAREVQAEFIEISAVTSGKKDVERIVEHARQNWNLGLRTILFVDEIHRFNKAQQDAFLPHVESGLITLIGATTENPSFEVITPLLSRARVLVLQPLTRDEIIAIIRRALKQLKKTKLITPKAIEYLAELSGGDARVALGNLELALSLGEKVTPSIVKSAAQRKVPGYDKKRRRPLRRHLGIYQIHARQRCRSCTLLPVAHDRRRRGPKIYRPSHGRVCERRYRPSRQRRA